MKLFSPNIQLFFKLTAKGEKEYYLHAISHVSSITYVSSGHESSDKPNRSGVFSIKLKIDKNGMPDVAYLTPVIHSFRIGTISMGNRKDVKIEVDLEDLTQNGGDGDSRGKGKKVGSSTVMTSQANEIAL